MNPAQSLINEVGQKISSLKTAQALYSRQLAVMIEPAELKVFIFRRL